jgi:ABC-type antimicrobial peptide transport system permease subunit
MAVFAVLSLFLGALGIYGVTAYAAGRRTNEIGIRMALGAKQGDVVRMVVNQGGRRAVLGLALGLVAAFFLTRGIGSILVGVEPFDPSVFALVTLVLALVSGLALLIPAWRASAIGPMAALDNE